MHRNRNICESNYGETWGVLYVAPNIAYIHGAITDETVRGMFVVLQDIVQSLHDRKNKKSPIKIIINSPGGDAAAMFAIIDIVNSMKAIGYSIHTYAIGEVLSAATGIFVAGDKRYATPTSRFMMHPVNTAVNYHPIKDAVALAREGVVAQEALLKHYADTCRNKIDVKKIQQLNAHITFMSAEEMRRHGWVDAIVASVFK